MKQLFTLLFSLFAWLSYSQSITGSVLTDSDEPLSFASIAVIDPLDSTLITGTISSIEGSFSLPVESGSYVVTASMTGYNPQSQLVTVNDQPLSLEYTLSESVTALEEVVVKADKPLFEQKIDRTVVNVQSSVTNVGTSALEVLTKSPGVGVDRISNTISLNGKSGTIILLNGKRVRLSEQSLIQYLEGLPSGSIEKLELFATPPANFDAEGNAGMINIVTARNEDLGFNGNVSAFTGYGERPKVGGTLNLNYRSEKVGYYLDLSSSNDYTRQDLTSRSSSASSGETISNELVSRRPAYIGNQRINTGLDYYLNDNTSFGVAVSGSIREWEMDATTNSRFTNAQNATTRFTQESLEINDWKDATIGLNFSQSIGKKGKLTADYDYLRYMNHNPTDYTELELENGVAVNRLDYLSRKRTPFIFHVTKVDYSNELSDQLSFETGAKLTLTDFENDLDFFDIVDNQQTLNLSLSDRFLMDERIAAAYLSTTSKLTSDITLKAGLRYEQTLSRLSSRDEGQLFDRNNHRLFPTIYLSKQLAENSTLGVSYSRRVVRPSFNALAPAFYFIDRRTVYTGNPTLNNILSDHVKLDYTVMGITMSAEFTDNRNPIAWAQPNIDENGVQFIRPEHLEDLKIINYNVDYGFNITRWWDNRLNVGVNWQYVKSRPESGQNIVLNATFVTANLTQTFQLKRDYSIEINSRFWSSRQIGVSHTRDIVSFNLGVQKEFKNQSKLSISVNDIFDLGTHFDLISNGVIENEFLNYHYELEGNVFRINYSVPFGNRSLKLKKRNSASTEERNRI